MVVGQVGDRQRLRVQPRGGGGREFGRGRLTRAPAGGVVGPGSGHGLPVLKTVRPTTHRPPGHRGSAGCVGCSAAGLGQTVPPRERASGVGLVVMGHRLPGRRRVFDQPRPADRDAGLVVTTGAKHEQWAGHHETLQRSKTGTAWKRSKPWCRPPRKFRGPRPAPGSPEVPAPRAPRTPQEPLGTLSEPFRKIPGGFRGGLGTQIRNVIAPGLPEEPRPILVFHGPSTRPRTTFGEVNRNILRSVGRLPPSVRRSGGRAKKIADDLCSA